MSLFIHTCVSACLLPVHLRMCVCVCVCLIVGARVCISAFFSPPSLVCFHHAVEILSQPNYRNADLVASHCCQKKKKELYNFELDFKKMYSRFIPSALISGLV